MKTILYMIVCVFLAVPALAMPAPDSYGYNECELIAKDFQEEFGGSLVFVQPLKENGAYDLSDYGGHFLNARYISGNQKMFYFDFGNQQIFDSLAAAETWYEDVYYGRQVEIWDMGIERPPFSIIWHFG